MDRALSPTAGSACPSRLGGMYPELRRADWDGKKRVYSYHRFDNEIRGPASIGGASFGHIEIDLKWNFRQSQWGCIEGDRPAGILYLDIGLHSHSEYKLVSINVEVTLEDVEADPSGAAVAGNAPKNTAKTPVQMTDWFGPKHILGRERPQLVTKESKLQPSFEGFGFGFGGVGSSVQKVTPINSRWEFAGRLKRPDRWKNHLAGGRHYKTLQWTVTENELESARNNTIHVAFTFEHGGQPFHMHAKVDGTLRRKRDRFVNGLRNLRFGPRRDQPGDVSTTYIGTYNGNRKPLDELAKGLDLAMQEKNWKSRPTEIPEPEQATFGEIQLHPDPLLTTSSHETGQAQQACNPTRPVMFDQFTAQKLALLRSRQSDQAPGQNAAPKPGPAITNPFQYMVSTPEIELRLALEKLAKAGQRFTKPPRDETDSDDGVRTPSLFGASGQSDIGGSAPLGVSCQSRSSPASVVSRALSSQTLVDQADQAAAMHRLPRATKKAPSRPAKRRSVSRSDLVAAKPDKLAIIGFLPTWAVAILRLYLLLLVGIPLRCLRSAIAIVATIIRLVEGVGGRISKVLEKHAQI